MKNKKIPVVITFSLIVLFSVISLYAYNVDLRNKLTNEAKTTLSEIIEQQANNIYREINSQKEAIETDAALIANFENTNDILQAIEVIASNTEFEFVLISDLQGESLIDKGGRVNIKDREYFQQALNGETYVSEPIYSVVTGQLIVPISTPIVKDDKITHVLTGGFSVSRFSEMLYSSFGGKGYAFIINEKGDYIAKTENDYSLISIDNIFDSSINNGNDGFADLKTLEKNVKLRVSGETQFIKGSEKRVVHYKPLNINDWMLFVAIPEAVIYQNTYEITKTANILAALTIAGFGFLLFYAFNIQAKAKKVEESNNLKIEKITYGDKLLDTRNFLKFKIDAQNILNNSVNQVFIIIKLDIENFKLINKTFGYEIGDEVLLKVSEAIQFTMHDEEGIYARCGVDEFVIFLRKNSGENHEVNHLEVNEAFVRKFHELMGNTFNYKVKFKSGEYLIDNIANSNEDITDYFEKANFAHRIAKQSSTVDYVIYDDSVTQAAVRIKDIENRMEHALANDEFKINLQPKYSLKEENICGAEALVRWEILNCTYSSPNEFIPIFERNGFIMKIDLYMVAKVCETITEWIKLGMEPLKISVNISRLHLNDPGFVLELCNVVDRYEVDHKYIEIEITEYAILDNMEQFEVTLNNLHAEGFTVSMDDFGSGYSSLGVLKNLPVDAIKLDRSFFFNPNDEERAIIVVANIIRMAKELAIETIAEGIEEKYIIDKLRELGCDTVQGFYYSRPLQLDEFTKKYMIK